MREGCEGPRPAHQRGCGCCAEGQHGTPEQPDRADGKAGAGCGSGDKPGHAQKTKKAVLRQPYFCGPDGTRTRDLRRDRAAF
jgi:hypothetical protein